MEDGETASGQSENDGNEKSRVIVCDEDHSGLIGCPACSRRSLSASPPKLLLIIHSFIRTFSRSVFHRKKNSDVAAAVSDDSRHRCMCRLMRPSKLHSLAQL